MMLHSEFLRATSIMRIGSSPCCTRIVTVPLAPEGRFAISRAISAASSGEPADSSSIVAALSARSLSPSFDSNVIRQMGSLTSVNLSSLEQPHEPQLPRRPLVVVTLGWHQNSRLIPSRAVAAV